MTNKLVALIVSLPLIFGGCSLIESLSEPKKPEVKFFRDGYKIEADGKGFNYFPFLIQSTLRVNSDDGQTRYYEDETNNGSIDSISIPVHDNTYRNSTRFIHRNCRDERYMEECTIAQTEFENFADKYNLTQTHENWLTWLKENYPEEFGALATKVHAQHYSLH